MSVEPRPPSPTLISMNDDQGDEFGDTSGPETWPDKHEKLFTLPNGDPVRFFLHVSLTPAQRLMATEKITGNGGVLTSAEKKANIILVSKGRLGTTSLEILRLGWEVHPNPVLRDIRVENIVFLTQCINNGKFELDDRVRGKQRIAGRVGRTEPRRPFTEEDDACMCRYLADRIPNKDDGGRIGNAIWMELVKIGDSHTAFRWAKRHSWQSWRNRYSKNQAEFDPMVDQWAGIRRRPDHKGEYPYSRSVVPGRARQIHYSDDDEVDDDDDGEDYHEGDDDDLEGPGRADEPESELLQSQKRKHIDGGEARTNHAGPNDAAAAKKRRRTDPQDVPEVELGRGVATARQTGQRGMASEPSNEFGFEDQEGELIQFEDAGDNDLVYDNDYSQAGPSGTRRSPTPETAWDELDSTLAPQVVPISSAHSNAKGPKSARTGDKDKAKPPSSKPLNTTTNNNRNALVAAQGARKKTAQHRPPPPPLVPRITRARSKSLEPTAIITKASEAPKKKGNGRASALVPVAENQMDEEHESDFEEADEQINAGPQNAAISGRTQTYEEEHAVDGLLNEGASMVVVDPEPEDDAQTRRAFEAADNDDNEDEDNMEDGGGHARLHPLNLSAIDRLQSRHKTRRGSRAPSRAPSVFTSRSNQPLFEINGAPSLRSSIAPPSQLITPMPHRRTRSTRATELVAQFPSPGTRAKDVKEQKERESKHTPYEPPVGTRASAHKARRLA